MNQVRATATGLLLSFIVVVPFALANGGYNDVDISGSLPVKGGECVFTLQMDPVLFRVSTLEGKYRVIRIKIRNDGGDDVALAPENDSVRVQMNGLWVDGILDLAATDKDVWEKSLDDKARHDLAYPQKVAAGEEHNVFVYVPVSAGRELPTEITYRLQPKPGQAMTVKIGSRPQMKAAK